ncbi:Sec63-domain-containing protein [Flagelloscypha sp. PMI_526]|nr:Sec63-domain-containing protein [Flagelloscypha sp. PMI_526]
MSIQNHLEFLLGSSKDTGDRKSVAEEWFQSAASLDLGNGDGLDVDVSVDSLEWETVTGAYSDSDDHETATRADSDSATLNPVVTKLIQLPNFDDIYDPILRILESSRNAEEIPNELLDLLGFDAVELVMEITLNPEVIASELKTWRNQGSSSVSKVPPAITENEHDLSHSNAQQRLAQQLEENASRPLWSGTAQAAPEILPHVYSSSLQAHGNVLSQLGHKYMLPLGTTRTMYDIHEEVVIPPARPVPPKPNERLIPISELDRLCKGSFPGYSSLNRIQSIVYPTAYGTNENMLICAPTGAGKTDVAMLTVLRVLSQHQTSPDATSDIKSKIARDSFKIIYVAPMKALAAEIVRKLGKRLKWLDITVSELTGDMQMTKAEIAATQIIVTTPEKWDVVTRKPTGEGELASSLKLLIIDEVHLLNEERGAVIETIVARTLRQVESSQSVIRIVGLSATLPNYIDVADFLSVSRYKGLFYFDSSFRPIPLEQRFIGVKGKPNSAQSRKNLDAITFEKVSELVAEGHQVMVFVHARKETVKTAMSLKETALLEDKSDAFRCDDHPQFSVLRRQIGESRNKEMKELFDYGFGIHHAGMLRTDRNMMERMFEAKAIKVLCCTATLAWGVNLPAHAVIIKGTQVYDSSRGTFVDLSVLDVLQIFGRAGRPGLETSGEGMICTTEDKLQHYLDAITSQHPIESQFKGGMIDSLNAEISLGTVASIQDGSQWLGYTYLFVRMRRNPFVYGLLRDNVADDPHLVSQRHELVTHAARELAKLGMITFDQSRGTLSPTDLGRIAAKYYIRHASIEVFRENFRPKMSEADVLAMLSMSTEFEQLQVRESELKELSTLLDAVPCDVKGVSDNIKDSVRGAGPSRNQDRGGKVSTVTQEDKVEIPVASKVNILLQAHISRLPIEDFALVSDTAYAAQNGGRIVRALLEIAISRKWANTSSVLMSISKSIEKRMWGFEQPLKQFHLQYETLHALEQWADEWTPAELASQSPADFAKVIHSNEKHASSVINAACQLPSTSITHRLQPLGHDLLRISLLVQPSFKWSSKVHGGGQAFWVWIEDADGLSIYQLSHLVFRSASDEVPLDFVIPIPGGLPPDSITIRAVSDSWIGSEDEVHVPLDELIMPLESVNRTRLLDLPFLTLSALNNAQMERAFRGHIAVFGAMQSQAFWSLVNTRCHGLLCGPTASGKTLLSQILVWTTLLLQPGPQVVLIVTPRRSIALDIVSDLSSQNRGSKIFVQLTSEHQFFEPPTRKTVRVITAGSLLSILSRQGAPPIPRLDLVLCENLEQLDAPYELAVSLLRHAVQSTPTRFVGLSSSLNDPQDLSAWLHTDPSAVHNFKTSDREQSLTLSTETFTIPHSAALFKAMAKPAHTAIQSGSSGDSAIVFVPSRAQCRPVALDLITQTALQMETARGYLPIDVSEPQVQEFLLRFQDRSLVDIVSRGVGFFHNGIPKQDRTLMLELFAEGILKVLIVPREACWTLPVRAAVVVVMGTQYAFVEKPGGPRHVRDYSLAEIVRMQGRAIRHHRSGHFFLFCHSEAKDTILRFLNDGLPLESQLLETDHLMVWYKAAKQNGSIQTKQQLVEALSFTFLSFRIMSNPSYYGFTNKPLQVKLSQIVDALEDKIRGSN